MGSRIIHWLAIAMALSCNPVPSPVAPIDASDAAVNPEPLPPPTSATQRACATLDHLGCPEAQPSPKGAPCAQSLALLVDASVITSDDIDCMSSAKTVDAVRLCHVKCR